MEKLSRDAILDTVKKLMNVTESKGATPGEVANAMAAAQALLHKHGLKMLDVEKHNLDKAGYSVGKDSFTSSFQNLPDYAKLLAMAICGGFDCRLITGWDYGARKAILHFVGQEADAAVSKYLYIRTCDELWRMASLDARSKGIGGKSITAFRASYICGAAEVIRTRLKQQKESDIKAEPKVGTLIVLKNQLIEDKIHQLFPRLRTSAVRASHGDGYYEGRQAGSRIDLSLHGVSNTQRSPKGHIK